MQTDKQIACKDGTRKNLKTQECEPIKGKFTRKKKTKIEIENYS